MRVLNHDKIKCEVKAYFHKRKRHRSYPAFTMDPDQALFAEVDCIPAGIDAFPGDFLSDEQRRQGGVLVHLVIFLYACAMTAFICDEYFVPALEAIVQRLRLSPDVAGATFMAMGASAPELFSSIAGSFVTEDDIGLGTILGSALFNILAISGVAGIFLGSKVLSIQWYPVARDCVVYSITIITLSVIIADNVVKWWEALTLLVLFALYILLMRFNRSVRSAVERLNCCCESDPEKGPLLDSKEELESSDESTVGPAAVLWRILMWPPSKLFNLTIPPVRFFPLTFAVSIVWMGALSYVAVWMVTIIGYTLRVPDSVSGLTLLAVGSSIPDLVSTVIVANSGEGNMAISNLLGSNIFDLAFCLGAPWFVKSLLSQTRQLVVYSSALVYTSATLLITLFLLLITFQVTGWKLSRKSGIACIVLYFISIILSCLYELNVFAVINKPTCF